MYWVYVVLNKTAGKRYIGQTNDLERRIAEHNGLSVKFNRYTGKYPGNWELVFRNQHSTRADAMKYEKWLKSGTGRKWLDEQFGRASASKAD